MQEYYEVSPSRAQLIFLLTGYLLGAIAIYFYLSPAFFKWAALAALTVAGFVESRRLIQHDIIRLRINLTRASIEVQHLGQPYFYCKYKVYQTRWFAILKLIDQQTNRTLILNSDCFTSIENYRRLRFDLRCLERSDAT
ncbi:hypothetical protein N8198_03780 [Gammaproteobacteria bacterium]|nr:hypothetical protein [Gammaproteobacteria bacterium]